MTYVPDKTTGNARPAILIIKLGALGDVVMATPLIEAIMAAHAGARIALLTTPAFAPLFEAWPDLEVGAIARPGAVNLWRMLRYVRSIAPQRIYDLQGNDRSAVLCALSSAPERVGNHPRFPYSHHPISAWRGQSHIFERMCAVLESAGVAVTQPTPRLPVSPAASHRIASWIAQQGFADRSFALLHAGASARREAKRWPHFAALARRLLDAGIAVVWLGGPDDRTLNAELVRAGGVDTCGLFDIGELAELGRHARFAVTNDSGPMHVLSAAAIPVFGLFGPSDWRRNHALGQRQHVIACVDIDPNWRGQRSGDCLAGVSVEVVWSRLAAAGVLD